MLEFNKEKNFVDDYVVFDLETTGLDSDKDRIIEIGALKYVNGDLVGTFSELINPECLITPIITNITGINSDDVKDCRTIAEVLPDFIDFIGNFTLVAHNSAFDLGFIEKNIKRLGLNMITNKNIDTVELARKYIPEAYNYKLSTLKKYFHLEYGSHRSVDDCKTTNYVYEECAKRSTVKI